MSCSRILIAVVVMASAAGLVANGQEPAAIRASELAKHTLEISGLKIVVEKFRGGFLTAASMRVRVENPSAKGESFNPQGLSVVNSKSEQANVIGIERHGDLNTRTGFVQTLTIAPHAHMTQTYRLNRRVHLPVTLYYEGKELARLTE